MPLLPQSAYGLSDFERDIQAIKPRFFDTYVLPPFMIWFAMQSGKRYMGRWPRRALFTAGVYMLYRNYADYKKAYLAAQNLISQRVTEVIT